MVIELPSKVCILDLETEKTKFKSPEKSKLAFVGVKIYTLHNGRYYPGKHKCFLPKQVGQLEEFLKNFPGIIIGHNIFQFDYRVLRPLISLDKVIEKTVDTLAFLHKKNGNRFGGLALGALSKANLNKSKTLDGKSISELWRQGKHKTVIKYNENDCILTQALWWHLVSRRSISIVYGNSDELGQIAKTLTVSARDVLSLIGKKSLFKFRTWNEKIEKDGFILERESSSHYREVDQDIDYDLGFETEVMYWWFYCSHCRRTFLFESKILRGESDDEMVNCPKCGGQFGEIRAELGYTFIGSRRGNFGKGLSQGCFPDEFHDIVLKHMDETRQEWTSVFRQIYSGKHQCGICGNFLVNSDAPFYNPVDDSRICTECFTAGRWMLSLK